jgi:hypothetical protein
LVGRPEGNRPLVRPRIRCEDNIKIYLGDKEIDGANWIQLAEDRFKWRACMKTVMKLQVPQESRLCFEKLSKNQLFINILHH